MGIFDFLKRSKFSKMSSQVKVREQKYATLLCLEISSLANRRVTLEEKISDEDFKILTITAKALNIGSEYFDCELRKNYKANLDEGDKHFQEVLSSLDIKTKRATIKQMLLIHSNIEKLDNLLDENGNIIIRGKYMTPIERTIFQMGINEELEGLIKNMINEMNKYELNLTERSNSESDLTKIFSFNNDKNDFNAKDLKITGELDSSLEKKLEDDRLKQLEIEKKEWDLELSIDKEVICDDGVKRIYNGFMWGLIREIDKEKTINTTSIISHDKSDNISLSEGRSRFDISSFRNEIPIVKWFSEKGVTLNSHNILNYIPYGKIDYNIEFKDLLPNVRINPKLSKSIISINGYFFHADSFGSGEPVKLFSGIIDKKEYFNGIPLEESVLHTKKFNSESLKHAVIEWLDNKELAEARYGHISSWNTTEVTDMNRLFRNADTFNESIENWDFSNVTRMDYMFFGASNFNGNISNWNTSSVNAMSNMFTNAVDFDQPLDSWDVSGVFTMASMFSNANSFNQPLNNWDVSNVENMYNMFYLAQSFNQTIHNWDVSSVINMSWMFSGASVFNQPLNTWDVSSVENMGYMFFEANAFSQPLNNWDVSSVTNMQRMFYGANVFNSDITSWNVGNVTNMSFMFSYAPYFNQDIGSWDVSSVTNMSAMFNVATDFNVDISSWDVSSVTIMASMFNNAVSYNQDLSSWVVSQVTNCSIFSGSTPSWTLPKPNFTNCTQ